MVYDKVNSILFDNIRQKSLPQWHYGTSSIFFVDSTQVPTWHYFYGVTRVIL